MINITYSNNDFLFGESSIAPRDLIFKAGITNEQTTTLNNKENYLPKNEGTIIGGPRVVLNNAWNETVSIEGSYYPGLVLTKSINDDEKVEILYTTNNWKTASSVSAKLLSEYDYGIL